MTIEEFRLAAPDQGFLRLLREIIRMRGRVADYQLANVLLQLLSHIVEHLDGDHMVSARLFFSTLLELLHLDLFEWNLFLPRVLLRRLPHVQSPDELLLLRLLL